MFKRIADQRERLILAQAQSYLEEGESILHWVRAKQVEGRREGFVFLTDRRYIVHWTGRSEGVPGAFPWTEISGWGVSLERDEGPILGIETDTGETCYVQLRTATAEMADHVSLLLRNFAELVPQPSNPLQGPAHLGVFEMTSTVQIREQKMTVTDHTRRILVTLLGVALVVGAVLIIPLPGPWSFVVTIAGLAILASEYDWARDALDWTKSKYQQATSKMKARRQST